MSKYIKNCYLWGEYGLLSAFLMDLFSENSKKGYNRLLEKIELADNSSFNFNVKKVWCVIRPDLGRKGFGKPDAIVRLEDSIGNRIVLIFIARKNEYKKNDNHPLKRCLSGFNYSINGQLELNYCLTLALEQFSKKKDQKLVEPDWVLKTSYNEERVGKQRYVKNPEVINNIIRPITGNSVKQSSYYHIIVTNDKKNPFQDSNNYFPSLFQWQGKTEVNVWEESKGNFGWINYNKLNKISRKFKNSFYTRNYDFSKDYLDTLEDHELISNRGESIIYAPELQSKLGNNLFHFSWRDSDAALRDYSDLKEIPNPVYYKTADVRRKIIKEKIITFDNHKGYQEIQYWHDLIDTLKKEWDV